MDIDSFKKDLDQLKNQRSVLQAKLDDANRHVAELTETLKGMGFNSIDEAKQAYAKQCAEAESQHALVKQLISEISQVGQDIPSREEVMARLNALSAGDFASDISEPASADPIISNVIPEAPHDDVEVPDDGASTTISEGSVDLNDNSQPTTIVNDETAIQEEEQDVTVYASVAEGTVNLNNPAEPATNNKDVDLSSMLFASL